MSWISDIFVRIRGDKSNLDSTLSSASGSIKKFAGTVLAAAAAGGAAIKVLIDWFKEQDYGVRALNISMGVTKQLLTDLITGQGLHLGAAVKNAKALSKVKEDDAKEAFQAQKMQSELNRLIVDSADQTKSHAEKLVILTKAMEKQKELKAFLLADAREELKVAYDIYKINLTNTKARENFYAAAQRVAEVEGMDSRRLQSQFTAQLVEQKKRADELVDAFTPLVATLEEVKNQAQAITRAFTENISTVSGGSVFNPRKSISVAPGLSNVLAGGPAGGNQAMANAMVSGINESDAMAAAEKAQEDYLARWQENWKAAADNVTDMISDAFIGLFEAIGKGSFQGFGNDLLKNFGSFIAQFGKMLVAMGTSMLFALTLMKTPSIPTAVAAIAAGGVAMAIGGMMMGAASREGSAMSGGGGGGGSYAALNGPQTIRVEGYIKGKDIYLTNRRYIEDNG